MPDPKAPAAPVVAPVTPSAPVSAPAAPAKVEPKEAVAEKPVVPVEKTEAPAEKPVEKPAEKPTEAPVEAVEPKPDPQEPIGPRWFAMRTQSQLGVVNVLIKDAVRDAEANVAKAVERFKLGHGITSTPYEISAQDLGPDYKPTAADLDHHNAIEAANG